MLYIFAQEEIAKGVIESPGTGWIAAVAIAVGFVVQKWYTSKAKAAAETSEERRRDAEATQKLEASSNEEYRLIIIELKKQYKELKHDLDELMPKYITARETIAMLREQVRQHHGEGEGGGDAAASERTGN